MQFYNAYVFDHTRGFRYGGFEVEQGRFVRVLEGACAGPGVDLGGQAVIPGLVDIHIHGCRGADFSDGDAEGLRRMAEYLARRGVTSFAPTSMSLPDSALERAFSTAVDLWQERAEGRARVMGIHMEGPFFSPRRKGAQNGAWLSAPDFARFASLQRACSHLVRIVDLAPELEGAAQFARRASGTCTVSAAHTDAEYEQARAFFAAGAKHVTHLFNAMPPLHHRQPGVIGAAAEREDTVAELICDGIHVHPSAVRLAFRLFPGRVCLISDALRCCGMPEGSYTLGGQTVCLRGGAAYLSDGTLAGSASDLYDGMLRAVSFGIPVREAITAATLLPAGEIGAAGEIGSIAPGKYADFVVCDAQLRRRQVYIGGAEVRDE